ncbi:MAG: cation diffusion facilitator family transporter [Pirellulales bacterium]
MHQTSSPHDHAHAPANYDRAFAIGVALNLIYVAVEAGFGLLANSLALLADASHNLSDILGLLLAWGAHRLSQVRPSSRRTYGWKSSSILAALFNGLILLVAVGGITWEAIRRFFHPEPVEVGALIWVAGVGVIINAATALLFFANRDRDLNIRGAFLHMAADAAVSLGVVVTGVAIWLTGLEWIDPVTSLLVALVILLGTWGLLRESFDLALHAVPKGIDVEETKRFLATLPGVDRVHDVHIWAMSTTETALTAHLVKPVVEDDDALLAEAVHELEHRFGIKHATLQIERSAHAARCELMPDDVV